MAHRTLNDEPLRVSPALLGRELAGPWRRALALAVDLALLLPPTLALAVGAATLFLHLRDPEALRAIRALVGGVAEGTPAHHQALRDVAPLLVDLEAPGLPRSVREAVELRQVDEAVEELARLHVLVSLKLDAHGHETTAPGTVRLPVEALIPKTLQGVCLYGLAAAYFTLFHAGPRGATVGKRLLGIRVARLDGHRLSLPESFERFVGYLHIPGSLGLSLLDLWRDPNRRLPHDRVVHTAVLRLEPAAVCPQPAVEPAPEAEPGPETGPDSP